ncbi:MAG TPA: NAD(P)H-dependent glycerol-3-phosphate dehydrogenase [Candidatus Deferrimicrobiaceae bacterium]|nr:NAD(P)H-dependent glycerol-3-phosphate dehydrogenase [Candidatus Deferrimicrobiaceae bacterium]
MTGKDRERIAVVGGGSWGTAFAAMLAKRHDDVALWVREPEICDGIRNQRENRVFLPGIPVPTEVRPTTDLGEALAGRGIVAFAVPAQHVREVARNAGPHLDPAATVVSLAKGLENGTLLRMTEVLAQALAASPARIAVLSGPTFAQEVAAGMPTGATVASEDPAAGSALQSAFSGKRFRVYTGTDVIGIEIGGALKNVMAIAAGMSDGLGFGHNARALLISRGLAEISRVGIHLGADPQTFYGLSGLGDLVLTCTGDLSRNRTVGMRVGAGERVADILARMKMVAEGVTTAQAAFDLSRRTGVAMPISEQVHLILHEGKDARTAVGELFSRALRREKD